MLLSCIRDTCLFEPPTPIIYAVIAPLMWLELLLLNSNIFGEHFSQCANSCQVLQQQQVDQKKVYVRKKSGLISISKVFLNNCCSSIFGLSQTEIGRLFSLLGSLDTSSFQNNDLSIVRRLFSKPSKKKSRNRDSDQEFSWATWQSRGRPAGLEI